MMCEGRKRKRRDEGGREEGRRGCGSAAGRAGGRPAAPAGGFDLSVEGVRGFKFSAPFSSCAASCPAHSTYLNPTPMKAKKAPRPSPKKGNELGPKLARLKDPFSRRSSTTAGESRRAHEAAKGCFYEPFLGRCLFANGQKCCKKIVSF